MKAEILIVDDTPDNLRLLMGILTKQDYNVRLAPNGRRALSTTQTAPPDLILLDIRMPDMNGYEVCEQLKVDERTRDIPVLFISALNGAFDKVKAFSVGGVDYITKPFQPNEVLARVETHLSLRNLHKSLQQEVARRTQTEEELREINQQLKVANACKDRFFSIIAHDLRSPFSGLIGLIETVVENIDSYSQDKIARLLTLQHDAAKNVYNLLENLLSWSRIQRGIFEYHPQQVDMARIVAQNVALLMPNAEQKKITLVNSVRSSADESLFVCADFNMVNTVIRNLLSNAMKFTEADGTVEISAAQNERVVEVSVSDTGIGISAKYIAKLFRINEQYRRKGTANEPGTGLGLILCKEFVEQHGGRIWVESDVGKGSTFRFSLPQ